MMALTALSEHALGLLRKKGMTQLADADCFVDGWGIHCRNRQKRRHIRMTRGQFTWQETVSSKETRSSITIMGLQVPETMLVEERMVGKTIGSILDLPSDISEVLNDVVVTKRTADTTDYVPIPILILHYE